MKQWKNLAVFVAVFYIGLLSLVDSRHHEKGIRHYAKYLDYDNSISTLDSLECRSVTNNDLRIGHTTGRRRGERSQNGNSLRNSLMQEVQTTFPTDIFLSENCTQVFAQTGTTPILHCEVREIGDITVSWIRRKDFHLLTVGSATYSSDERFFTSHVLHPQDWALHIRFAGTKDTGIYECQASTHPPTSLFVKLQLVEARAEIHGAPEKFVMSGSSLKLTCKLLLSTEPPTYVFWYHEKRMINYDRERGVEVILGRSSSDLLIAKAQKADSGNYTCAPSNAQSASIIVHVINSTLEEKPAAMQHGSKNSSTQQTTPGFFFVNITTVIGIILVFLNPIHYNDVR